MPTTQIDCMTNLYKSYEEIRKLQTSLASLAESVPGIRADTAVTTVEFPKMDTELSIRQVDADRDAPEITVCEHFFPEGDTKYMCGIRIGNGKDAADSQTIYSRSREALPDLIRKCTEPEAEPIPEKDVNQLKYLMSDISAILSKHGASLDAVPGGLRLRTGEPGKDSVKLALVDREAE